MRIPWVREWVSVISRAQRQPSSSSSFSSQPQHPSSQGGGGGSSHEVGEYIQDGSTHDLTDDHVEDTPDGFRIDAPDGAAEIHVNPDYIQDRLGAWGADRAYTATSDRVVVGGDVATFHPFAADTDETFTRGSGSSIRFVDRPMWLAVDASSDRVVLSAHDGDTTGQKIRVDADWLADRGIQDPLVHHEDGAVLDVTSSPSGGTYIVDVPHFSDVIIEDPTLDESWKTESFTRYYDADGPVGAFPFNISVSDVTEGNMTLRYWDEDNGTHTAFDGEVFNKTTRESLNRSGYYSLNFINETNVDNLEATLGTSLWNLTDVTLTSYVFTNPSSNLTYHFDKDEGWIRKVTDAGNGAEVVVSSTSTGGEGYPTEGPLGGPEEADLTTTPIEAESKWDSGGDHAATVSAPSWSGGNSDEKVPANLLSFRTEVTAKADFDISAAVVGLDSCNKEENNCEARSHTKYFHVHWDFSDDDLTSAQVICPDGNGPCDEGTSTAGDTDKGTHELTGYIRHDDCAAAGLLCSGSVEFWVCGHAFVYEDNDPIKEDHMQDCEKRPNFHPGHTSQSDEHHGEISTTVAPR